MQLLQTKKVKWTLLVVTWTFIFIILILPLILVVSQAFAHGWRAYLTTVSSLVTLQAINLTVAATLISIGFNLVFGVSAAWLAPLFDAIHIQIVFAPPAIFLTTIFVTFPFVAREVIPVLEAKGREEEQTAALLGANLSQIMRQITFPAIKTPLATGLVLATARALGEFGAVAVVSGNIRGKTLTLSLLVQTLYNDFKFNDAFAVATILLATTVLVVTLKRRVL